MASTSTREQAAEIFRLCLEKKAVPDELLLPLAESAAGEGEAALQASRSLFAFLVEPLADRFEPSLVTAYTALFSRVIVRCLPSLDAAGLVARFQRIRVPRHFDGGNRNPRKVFVLSRVTLGADVAVTSIVLDAAKTRFPAAEVIYVGGRKGYELFAGDTRIGHLEAGYQRRGSLRQRLAAGLRLREAISGADAIVIDPDSRITQLGLLPVCPEENYYFFDTRSYGGESDASLGQLTRQWVAEVFGVVDAVPFICPAGRAAVPAGDRITVSFGVGENPAKRIADPFEERLLKKLSATGRPLLVDKGAGGEEAERVNRAIASCGLPGSAIETWEGAFAPFAASIGESSLFVGYDSAGQHVAAATRTPLVSIFSGYCSERFLKRWSPYGPGPMETVRIAGESPEQVLRRAVDAVRRVTGLTA